MTDTNELRKLLEKATPRPWIVEKDDYWDSWSVTGPAHEIVPGWPQNEPKAFDDGSACGEYGPSCTESTRDLIVTAVNALPAMLDELDAARSKVKRLRACVALLERVRNEAEWVRKAYELDDNDDQGATDLCAALDAAKEILDKETP